MTNNSSFILTASRWTLAVILLLFSISFAVSVGSVSVPITHVWGIMADKIGLISVDDPFWSKGQAAIVWQVRLPRAILAAFVGAGLAVTGTALQSVTRNSLADPYLLGISSGAAFGAILALLHTGLFLGIFTVPLFAFFGALGSASIVYFLISSADGCSANRLVLTGVAVSFIVMGMANGLIFLGDPKASHTVVFWMLGGLGLASWKLLIWPATILLFTAIWFRHIAKPLDAMMIGDETAFTLGISPKRIRLQVFIVSALLTGVMVAFSGMIGFVGLMIPHITRLIFGSNNEKAIPACLVVGSIFLIWADILARVLVKPEDMPIGIITGLAGGLFFLGLLRRNDQNF